MSKDTRKRLIEATIDSIYQYGYNDTTVTRISDMADTALGTVNHHFSGKDELLAAAMRSALNEIYNRLSQRIADAGSPRGKLWAVIESVLGDEETEDKNTAVWFIFWMQAESDDRLRRLRDMYSRRLQSNVRRYFRLLLREIGAQDIDDRTQSGSMMLISLMHGVWLSYTLREDLSQDLSHGRLLVWECLEMLLSRAREPLQAADATVATSASLLANVSMEVVNADIKKLPVWQALAPAQMEIYLPHFRDGGSVEDKASAAVRLMDAGFCPVAHIAARNVRSQEELDRLVAGLSAVGVRDFLLLGGSEAEPAGDYDNALQLLSSGVLQRYGCRRVGFAGHPEQHPDQPRDVLRRALTEKIAVAKSQQLECFIITQFCFAPRPFYDFLDWVTREKFNVPVRLGVAGRVNAARLMRFAVACGIGRSLSFVRRQFNRSMGLVNYSPDGLIAELAAGTALRRYPFPVDMHFYPFGSVADTLNLVADAVPGSDGAAAIVSPEPV